MRIKYLFIILCTILFIGCTTTISDRNINIDASLMQECPPLPELPVDENGKLPMGDLLLDSVEITGLYKECASGKAGLVEAVEKLKQDNK